MRKPLLSWLFVLTTCGVVRADAAFPTPSYQKASPNGKFLFVMLSSAPLEEDEHNAYLSSPEEVRRLRKTYPASGLYRNDGSTSPVWTVDWYAQFVEVASNGVHLVRSSPIWAWKSKDTVVLTFFANGKQLRLYTVQDLIANPEDLPQTGFSYQWAEEPSFDDRELTYRVTTREGRCYLFDVRNGEIRSSYWRARRVACGVAIAGVLLVFFVWFFTRRRRRGRG